MLNELQCRLIIEGYWTKWDKFQDSSDEVQKKVMPEMREFKKEFDLAVKQLNKIKGE